MNPSGTKKKVTLSRFFFDIKSVFILILGVIAFLYVTRGSGEIRPALPVPTASLSNMVTIPDLACKKLWNTDHRGTRLSWSFNSGNPAKRSHFKELFAQRGLNLNQFQKIDVKEIDASHKEVVVHKASSMNRDWVLVEDSALDIENADVGVNIKWKLRMLPDLIGSKATYSVKIAYKVDEVVYVYSGSVDGTIVKPRGPFKKGAEFDPYFQPVGSSTTLAEGVDESRCPRDIAIKKVKTGNVDTCTSLLTEWKGDWQKG